MDYFSVFDISASGMNLERLRMQVAAANIANANVPIRSGSTGYVPGRVVSTSGIPAGTDVRSFEQLLGGMSPAMLTGVLEPQIQAVTTQPRLDLDPGHPDADGKGFVAYPSVDPLQEMVTLTVAVRSYEANVRAMEASRNMIQKALEIGGR